MQKRRLRHGSSRRPSRGVQGLFRSATFQVEHATSPCRCGEQPRVSAHRVLLAPFEHAVSDRGDHTEQQVCQ